MNQTVSELADLLDRPETHQIVLNGYTGEYSLGITRCDRGPGGYGFLLRINGEIPPNLPTVVKIGGRQVPVIIQGGFVAPKPL